MVALAAPAGADAHLRSGVVAVVVPGTIARVIVSVTISAGAAATALGLLVFEESFDRGPGEEPSKDETRLG